MTEGRPGRRRVLGRQSGPVRLPADAADGPDRNSRELRDPFLGNARRHQ